MEVVQKYVVALRVSHKSKCSKKIFKNQSRRGLGGNAQRNLIILVVFLA
jgi:hypothetical protein